MRYIDNRHRTRDLLLEYEPAIMPLHPRAGGLAMVYPWGNDNTSGATMPPFPDPSAISSIYPWEMQNLAIMGDWLFNFATNSGYKGTREEFYKYFGTYLETNRQEILFETFDNFPSVGTEDMLYFDLNEKVLYYWNEGYIPVNAMLITNTILNGGEA
jgi:hypothetical protein